MKNLIVLAAITITAVSSTQSFAGSCRIITSPHCGPVCPPPPQCEVYPRPPVCIPVHDCHIAPVAPVCPPVHRCRIKVCVPPPVRCVIRPCEPKLFHHCSGHVCQCHKARPVCRIRTCEPIRTCQIVCQPVHTCRIKPCETTHPGYGPPPEPQIEVPVDLPQVESGQEVTIDGQQFGFQPGSVAVRVGGLVLQAEVTGWSNTEVRAIIPNLPLGDSAEALVAILDASGQIADQLDVIMVPQSQPQLARR